MHCFGVGLIIPLVFSYQLQRMVSQRGDAKQVLEAPVSKVQGNGLRTGRCVAWPGAWAWERHRPLQQSTITCVPVGGQLKTCCVTSEATKVTFIRMLERTSIEFEDIIRPQQAGGGDFPGPRLLHVRTLCSPPFHLRQQIGQFRLSEVIQSSAAAQY